MQCLSKIRSVFRNMSYCIALVPKDILYCNHEHFFLHMRDVVILKCTITFKL